MLYDKRYDKKFEKGTSGKRTNKNFNRKSQVFIVGTIFIITIGLITSFIVLNFLYNGKSLNEHLGVYQSGMVDAMVKADKAQAYIDTAVKFSIGPALQEFSKNGGINIIASDGELSRTQCGKYIYNLWNSENSDCFPDYTETYSAYIQKYLDTHISELNDDNLKKYVRSIAYNYAYDNTMDETTIRGFGLEDYDFIIYKTPELEKSLASYVASKAQFSGTFIWPVDGKYYISSCFGYRGNIGVSGATTNHAGIDIPAPMGTSVFASADGTIISMTEDQGSIWIEHAQGIRTQYYHMSAFKTGLKKGDTVKQGDIIGYVGNKGVSEAPHLHFAVVDNNIDNTFISLGVPAFIQGSYANTRYVNPVCFVKDSLEKQNIPLTYNTNSIACQPKVCDTTGRCISTPQPQSSELGGVYKYCGLYSTSTISVQKGCQDPARKGDGWDITNIYLSSTELSVGKTLDVTITAVNNGVDCVTLTANPKIILVDYSSSHINGLDSPEYWSWSSQKTDVYVTTPTVPYTNIAPLECTFSKDVAAVNAAQKNGRCVLLAPSVPNTKYHYQIIPNAVDENKRSVGTSNTALIQDFYVNDAVANSQPVATTSPTTSSPTTTPSSTTLSQTTTSQSTASQSASSTPLTSDEQRNFQKTKDNLELLKLTDYITEMSAKENVPLGIVLGVITVESRGDMGGKSSAGAFGLGQVTPTTYNDPNLKFDSKCSWEQFQIDGKCQIRAIIAILKQKYAVVNGRTLYYSCTRHCPDSNNAGKFYPCTNSCDSKSCQGPINTQYSGWDAALREYNGGGWFEAGKTDGTGCGNYPDYTYVDKVMKYAQAWGYIGQYNAVSNDEIDKGILGHYIIKPTFTSYMQFDMGLFETLVSSMKDATKTCIAASTTQEKGKCMQEQVDKFNNEVSSKYIAAKHYVNLSMGDVCDDYTDETAVRHVIEDVEKCSASVDVDCQCMIRIPSDTTIPKVSKDIFIKLISGDDVTTITYISNVPSRPEIVDSTYAKFYDDKDVLLLNNNINLSNISIYKDATGLKLKKVDSPKMCQPVDNKFRLCLKTNYVTTRFDYSKNNFVYDKVNIDFAVTVRDNKPPAPILGLELTPKLHSKNSVIVTWQKSPEPDVASYNIYLADTVQPFSSETKDFKKAIFYRVLNLKNDGFPSYKNIDYTAGPECVLTTGVNGKYCIFKYSAVDTDGKPVKITLDEHKIYYISSTNKFLYILDGRDSYDALMTDKDKFVAVTAIDLDGNEINNKETDQKIAMDKNLKKIKIADNEEPGLTEITGYNPIVIALPPITPPLPAIPTPGAKSMTLSWSSPKLFIDGIIIDPALDIIYKIYLSVNNCKDDELCQASAVNLPLTTTKSTHIDLDLTLIPPGSYSLAVVASANGKEYGWALIKRIIIK